MTSDRDDLVYQQAVRYAAELRELYEQNRIGAEELRARRGKAERVNGVLERQSMRAVFQPIRNLATGELAGYEALTRVEAEPRQPPNRWFEDAAEVGLGIELELAAVRGAIAEFERLPKDVFLSMNISPRSIDAPWLMEVLGRIPLARVVVEVTEHAPVDDYELLGARLRPFREGGGRLAVDDAGAGFASLRHILSLAPDVIKLDTTITRTIDRDRARRALASALISFAGEMGMAIVAEGIETQSELAALRDLGVKLGQGYHLGRPEPLPNG